MAKNQGGYTGAKPNWNSNFLSGMWNINDVSARKLVGQWYAVAPNAPTIGTATKTGETTATVIFTAPADDGGSPITSYSITSSPAGGSGTLSQAGSGTINVTGLNPGTTYSFTVRATNLAGQGAASAASNSITTDTTIGQQAYTVPGTYSWVAPAGTLSVSVVAVGGGGRSKLYSGNYAGGGSGGGLGYVNNVSVTAGQFYTVVVGAAGANHTAQATSSYFITQGTVRGEGGFGSGASDGLGNSYNRGGNYTGAGGGSGGQGGKDGTGNNGYCAGGGAGGYSGSGGWGGGVTDLGTNAPSAGSGGGGGGGSIRAGNQGSGGGGGVGLLGQGSNGAAGSSGTDNNNGGGGGSGGANGTAGSSYGYDVGGVGGAYGGGGGGSYGPNPQGAGADGAVRLIWPGASRSFPSTNTINL